MTTNNAHYRIPLDDLSSTPTLDTISGGGELKIQDDRVQVWLIDTNGNGPAPGTPPWRYTGAIDRRDGSDGLGGRWYTSEYYNAENTNEHTPGPFAHNFE